MDGLQAKGFVGTSANCCGKKLSKRPHLGDNNHVYDDI